MQPDHAWVDYAQHDLPGEGQATDQGAHNSVKKQLNLACEACAAAKRKVSQKFLRRSKLRSITCFCSATATAHAYAALNWTHLALNESAASVAGKSLLACASVFLCMTEFRTRPTSCTLMSHKLRFFPENPRATTLEWMSKLWTLLQWGSMLAPVICPTMAQASSVVSCTQHQQPLLAQQVALVCTAHTL